VKVFLSWSGEKSREVAAALRDWLPAVIQEIEPFMSAEDIEAGARWQQRISDELEGTSFGILCITRENQSAPWLNFEAGAVAKQVDTSRVVPLAVDLTTADVRPPLGLFQAKELTQSGLLSILESINARCERPVDKLGDACDVWWPKLQPRLEAAVGAADPAPVRSERELLEEILETVRSVLMRSPSGLSSRSPEFLEALAAIKRFKEDHIESLQFSLAADARDIEKRLLESESLAPAAMEWVKAHLQQEQSNST
jgi:hypothetical protein